jgi:hypothetical protein
MFEGCTSLNYIKCLAVDISAADCTKNWINGVASTGTFIMHPDATSWTIGKDGIPTGWVREIPNTVKFVAEEVNSTIGLESLSTNQKLYYRTINTEWNEMDTSTTITLTNVNDEVYMRGMLSADNNLNDYTQFKMSGKIAAYGNCNAIWNYEDLNAPLRFSCGNRLFHNCVSLTIAPELPTTTLAGGCYQNMFSDCTSLTTAPELPATTLVYGCYSNMFNGCTSLIIAPELPATTLHDICYYCMFCNCRKLNYIKCLATDITATNCTKNWVSGVASTGTFVKHPNMNSWTTGDHGIPTGWTEENAVL